MKKSIAILGAGITGLVSAYYLSKNFQVYLIEQKPVVGGMSTSFKHDNLTLDYGPHKLYTQLPGIMAEIAKIVPLVRIKKKNSIYLLNNYFDFPLNLKQLLFKMPGKAFSAGIDVIKKSFSMLPDNSYENYLINRFGKTMYSLVFKSYAEKIWGNPQYLDIELAKRRVAVSGIFQLAKSILLKDSSKISAEYFFYPVLGNIQLVNSLLDEIKKNSGVIITNAKIKKISISNVRKNKMQSKDCRLSSESQIFSEHPKVQKSTQGLFDKKAEYILVNNKKIKIDFLVSTIYLDNLLGYLNADKEVIEAGSNLSYKDTNIIYFILDKKTLADNWVFFPEKKFLFNRISSQESFSPYINPGNNVLVVETTLPLDSNLVENIKNQLINLKLLPVDIKEVFARKLEKAYPIYKKAYKKNLGKVISYLDTIENLFTIGRQGLFNYNNVDQCWDMALKLANHLENNRKPEDWLAIRKSFSNYKIID